MVQPDLLSTLPIELFELIAEHVKDGSKEDLTSLRGAGSLCAAKVWTLYKQCRFTEITVQLSDLISIRNATAIISSKDVGSVVRNLALVDNSIISPSDYYDESDVGSDDDSRIYSDDSEDGEEALDAKDAENDTENDTPSGSQAVSEIHATDGLAGDAYEGRENELISWQAQEQMRKSGEDRWLLMKLFSKLDRSKRQSRKVSILFQSARDCMDENESDDHCFSIVMLAMASCTSKFAAFSMDVQLDQAIDIHGHGRDYKKGIICKAALSRCKEVSLVMEAFPGDNGKCEHASRFLGMITTLNIRSLQLLDCSYMEDKPTAELSLELKYPTLETLDLDHGLIHWVKLVRFIKRHKKLQTLVINWGGVQFDGRPSHIHTCQQTTHELSRLFATTIIRSHFGE
jgi:hypothetical protein